MKNKITPEMSLSQAREALGDLGNAKVSIELTFSEVGYVSAALSSMAGKLQHGLGINQLSPEDFAEGIHSLGIIIGVVKRMGDGARAVEMAYKAKEEAETAQVAPCPQSA